MRIKILERSKCGVTTLVFALAATLTACGGGGVTGASLSGRVIDGYLTGAVVCLDVDNNKACGAGEPTAVTKDGGHFVLNPPSGLDLSTVRLIVDVPPEATDEDTSAVVGSAFQLTAPANLKVVTPLTTVALAYMDEGNSWEEAVDAVKLNLGITSASFDVAGDFVANTNTSTHNVARMLAGVFKENQIQGSAKLRSAVSKLQPYAMQAFERDSALSDSELNSLVISAAYASRQQVFASSYKAIGDGDVGAWVDSIKLYAQGVTDTGGFYGRSVDPTPDDWMWNQTWMGVAEANDPTGNGANFYWGSWDPVITGRTYMETWVRASESEGADISRMSKLNIKIWGHPDSAGVATFTPILEAVADEKNNCSPKAELSQALVGATSTENALDQQSDAEYRLSLDTFTVTEGCGRITDMSDFVAEKLRFVRVRVYLSNATTSNVGINVGTISFEP